MDSNTPEKKPKRPRIGQPIQAAGESHDSSYERPYTPAPRAEGSDNGGEEGGYQQRPGQRPYNNQGGYQPRQQRPYNNQGGQQGGYQRPQRPYNNQGGQQGG